MNIYAIKSPPQLRAPLPKSAPCEVAIKNPRFLPELGRGVRKLRTRMY